MRLFQFRFADKINSIAAASLLGALSISLLGCKGSGSAESSQLPNEQGQSVRLTVLSANNGHCSGGGTAVQIGGNAASYVCNGTNGNALLNGNSAPGSGVGSNGDFYLNTSSAVLYGPKANDAWPASGVALIGASGPTGAAGANGNTVLNGVTAPTADIGNNGDFYIETNKLALYGPKANGVWPSSAISLIGPSGAPGAPGTNGNTILNGQGAPGSNVSPANGDFYIDLSDRELYGPYSSATGWPSNVISLVGATGAAGSAGVNGNTILNGIGAPGSGLGTPGDFYIDLQTTTLYGPATSDTLGSVTTTIWPAAGISLIGNFKVSISSAPGALTAASNSNYLAAAAGLVNYTLPANPNPGDTVQLKGSGSGGFSVVPNSGQKIDLTGLSATGVAMQPANWAQTFTPSGAVNWGAIAISGNGKYVVAAAGNAGGRIYLSSDYGASWSVANVPGAVWSSAAISKDGNTMIVASQSSGVYVSTNYGSTWNQALNPGFGFGAVTVSSDGNHLTATPDSVVGVSYFSSDAGNSWQQSTLPAFFSGLCAASSSDGSLIFLGSAGGGISISTDYGATWASSSANTGQWGSCATNDDGSTSVAFLGIYNYGTVGSLYMSTNFGKTWSVSSAPATSWTSIWMNGDASYIVAANSGSPYVSTDSGQTWIQIPGSQSLTHIVCNSKANLCVAGNASGEIFVSQSQGQGGALGNASDAMALQYLGNGTWGFLSAFGNFTYF